METGKMRVIIAATLFLSLTANAWEKKAVVLLTERTGVAQIGPYLPFYDGVIDQDGYRHLVWEEYDAAVFCPSSGCSWRVMYAKQQASCTTLAWQDEQLLYELILPDGVGTRFRPSIVASDQGCIGIIHWGQGTTENRALRLRVLPCDQYPDGVDEEVPTSGQLKSGRPSSIVFDSVGRPRIAWFRRNPNQLRYASRELDGTWTTEMVGFYYNPKYPMTLMLDPDETPVIVFHDPGPIDVARVEREETCTTGTCWTYETVAGGGDYSVDGAISRFTGEETIVFGEADWISETENIGLSASINGVIGTVDFVAEEDVSRFVSAALFQRWKEPAAAYYYRTAMRLRFARFNYLYGWFPETVVGTEANEEVEEGADVGRLPVLLRVEEEDVAGGFLAEILYTKSLAGLVLGSEEEEIGTVIKIAAQPDIATASTRCPDVPQCEMVGGTAVSCNQPSSTTTISGSFELTPCLNCPDTALPDPRCPLIYCPPDDPTPSPVCERCTLFGTPTFDLDLKGQEFVDSPDIFGPEEGLVLLQWDPRRQKYQDVTGVTPNRLRTNSLVVRESVHGGWEMMKVE